MIKGLRNICPFNECCIVLAAQRPNNYAHSELWDWQSASPRSTEQSQSHDLGQLTPFDTHN